MTKSTMKKRYNNFPRIAKSELFFLCGEKGTYRNWVADGRIIEVERHERRDVLTVQCGYKQTRKKLQAIFPRIRGLVDRIQKDDNFHAFGTSDMWGSKRVFIISAMFIYPNPTQHELDEVAMEMKLWKLRNPDEDEATHSLIRYHQAQEKNYTPYSPFDETTDE